MLVRKLLAIASLAVAALAPAAAHAYYATFVDMESHGDYTHTDGKTAAIADAGAKKGCVKLAIESGAASKGAKCVLLTSGSGNGYLAIAKAKDSIGFGFSDDLSEARAQAMASCANASKGNLECVPASHWENREAGRARTTQSSTTSRNVVRCQNTCTNGSCLRRFEDGRTERWQAPRKFDPFTNNWGWDTMTNACGT